VRAVQADKVEGVPLVDRVATAATERLADVPVMPAGRAGQAVEAGPVVRAGQAVMRLMPQGT